MLFALIKKSRLPVKIVSWTYSQPGQLTEVRDSTSKIWDCKYLIPIGFKTYRKVVKEVADKQAKVDLTT